MYTTGVRKSLKGSDPPLSFVYAASLGTPCTCWSSLSVTGAWDSAAPPRDTSPRIAMSRREDRRVSQFRVAYAGQRVRRSIDTQREGAEITDASKRQAMKGGFLCEGINGGGDKTLCAPRFVGVFLVISVARSADERAG